MKQKKHTFLWLGFTIITLMIMAGAGYFVLEESKQTLTQTAKNQLTALKRGNYSRAYYLYTSDNYQEQNTLEQFRNWVKTRPILTDNDSVDFFGENIRGDHATLSGELKTNEGSLVPIIYRMSKEYGEWKIDSIQTMSEQIAMTFEQKPRIQSQDYNNEHLVKVVQDHLLDLKYRNIKGAYENYLSGEFKKIVPYEEFETIVRENPELVEFDSIRFGEIKDDNGLKQLSLSLISDEDIQNLQYWLEKDRGQWKIWAVEVNGPTPVDSYEVSDNTADVEKQPQSVTSGALKIIREQLQDLKKGDTAKAYSDYVSHEFTKATSEEDFEKFIKNYPEFTKFSSMKVENQTEKDGLVHVMLILTTEKGDSDVDYWLAKEDGDWKIWGIRVEESAYYPPITDQEKTQLLKVIEGQLKALREGDISKAYYAFSSQDFQNNTSFEDFQAFLKDYPIFTKQKEATIGHGVQEGKLRLIRIALQSEEGTSEVDYRLIKQDGSWKIWGIQILTNVQDTPENEEKIKQLIDDQFKALRADDLSKAYYAFASKQFQEAASFDAFQKYVSRHPELGNNKEAQVIDLSFKPAYVSAAVVAEGLSGDKNTYQYRLIRENNQWKILSIKMFRDQDDVRKNQNPLEISKVQMGTEIGLDGIVTDPKVVFSPQDKEITVNVYIQNGNRGDQVEAVLEHAKSNSSIPPVTAVLDKPGESVVNYVFTAPSQGWPTGKYRLHISSPSGESKVVEFDVKKHENNSRPVQESKNQHPEGTENQTHSI